MGTLSSILGEVNYKDLTKTEKIVKDFFDANEQKKSAEKKLKECREKVDEIYQPGQKEDLKRIGIEVNYSSSESSYIDSELLLEKVKELGLTDCVKTREYVDEEQVMQKLLDGEISPDVLTSCNKIKVTNKLFVKRIK